jgi:PAT family beta-lactamase induction signal transducer AmpG
VTLAAVAICSATHDVAADGFYLLALSSHDQAWYVGIRSIAYRIATIATNGPLVILAGMLEASSGLPTMVVEVSAIDRVPAAVRFAPEEFAPTNDTAAQAVVLQAPNFEISFADQAAADIEKLQTSVRKWNVQHGFYAAPEGAEAASERAQWLVSLEGFIKRHFGPSEPPKASDRVGDAAVVLMRMARQVGPGEEQTVQFGRASGDKSFKVIEGERFVVTEANWTQPFAALVQVDAGLNAPSQATFEVRSGNLPFAWSVAFFVAAGVFVAFCIYHFIVLPRPPTDIARVAETSGNLIGGFLGPFVDFFRKPRILAILAFLLLYRFPEAHLVKLATPFLLDPREVGGLSLTTGQVGIVYGTIGVFMLLLGGLIGGFVAARDGLKHWLWPMALAIHLPNFAFLYLAYAQPENIVLITAAVAVEQFGYGFGFTAYLLYCVYVATGKHETVHYALCTGCMAMGMMIPGMWSGWLQDLIGYQHFFVWVILAMIPSLLAVAFIRVDPEFGKKAQ